MIGLFDTVGLSDLIFYGLTIQVEPESRRCALGPLERNARKGTEFLSWNLFMIRLSILCGIFSNSQRFDLCFRLFQQVIDPMGFDPWIPLQCRADFRFFDQVLPILLERSPKRLK